MNGSTKRLFLLAAVALVAVLTVGATAAGAHRGPGRGGPGGASASALVTEAAKQLGVTRARLVDAIEKSAVARIDEAVEDGDLPAADAADLKEAAGDNLRYALDLSRTRTVASNLGITTAKLNTEFRDARRALLLARVADALEDGRIDADEAAEAREEIADADLPGYKAGGFGGGRGFGFGFHGPRR